MIERVPTVGDGSEVLDPIVQRVPVNMINLLGIRPPNHFPNDPVCLVTRGFENSDTIP